MRKGRWFFLVITLAFAFPSVSFGWGVTGDAENFIKAQRYTQAISILEKEVANDPSNHEAYFLLGKAYVGLGKYESANKEFSSAVAFREGYRVKVTEVIYKEFDKAFTSNNPRRQRGFYRLASQWHPALTQQIDQNIFEQGKSALENNQVKTAVKHFDSLSSLTKAYNEEISNLFYSHSQYDLASKFSSSNNAKIFAEYKAKMEAAKSEVEYNRYRKLAGKYGNLPPDYIVYGPRITPYAFRLDTNQRTDHFIRLRDEVRCEFFGISGKFILLLRDGRKINISAGEKIPNNLPDFKILAIEKGCLGLKIGAI